MIRLAGFGLHGGRASSVVLRRAEGATTVGRGDDRAPLSSLAIRGGDRATTATLPSGAAIVSVEHLLAAIAGMGAFHGLFVDVEGDEVPLLDGCAGELAGAIEALSLPRVEVAPAHVRRAAELHVHDAVYAFTPSSTRELGVDVDFPAARFGRALVGRASWSGDVASFRTQVAPSRTFGAARELEALRSRGLAAHVPAGVVVALDLDDTAWAPRDPDEPIRHKLLDLVGDLARLGAPLQGTLRVARPSHRASSEAIDRALAEGVVELPSPSSS